MTEETASAAPPPAPAGEAAAEESTAAHEATEARSRHKEQWWKRYRPSLAVSAFVMSLTVTLINAYYSVRGSDIVVLPPEQVLLYRDGEGANAVLAIAMQLNMINSASGDYGDVMVDASIQPTAGGPEFRYSSLVRPIFADTRATSDQCAFGSRCVSLPGLFLIESPDDLVALPGGGAKAVFLSFPATAWNCSGTRAQCDAFGTFDHALAAMGKKPLNAKVTVRFHSDGHRDIKCGGGPLNGDYLAKAGWLAAPCTRTKITGAPLI